MQMDIFAFYKLAIELDKEDALGLHCLGAPLQLFFAFFSNLPGEKLIFSHKLKVFWINTNLHAQLEAGHRLQASKVSIDAYVNAFMESAKC